MLTQEAMLNLASELTDADADSDATSLAAIAWRLYREAGENLAEVSRLRAAIHHAWNRPQKSRHRHQLPPERDQGRYPPRQPGTASRSSTSITAPGRRPTVSSPGPASTADGPSRPGSPRPGPPARR